jgi:hypothetical protein
MIELCIILLICTISFTWRPQRSGLILERIRGLELRKNYAFHEYLTALTYHDTKYQNTQDLSHSMCVGGGYENSGLRNYV